MAADSGDFGANGDLGDGDFRSVRKVFNGECAGGGVAGGGVPARERLRGGCLEGGRSGGDGARGVDAGGAMPVPGSGLGSGSGAGFRFVRTALGFGVGTGVEPSESPERTRRPRADFAIEDGPGVVAVRRALRRGVGAATSSSNSPSSSRSSLTESSSSPSGSELSDSTTFRRAAAARLAGLPGVIVDIESTELNDRFVVGGGLWSPGERRGYLLYLLYLIYAMRQVGKSGIKTLAVLAAFLPTAAALTLRSGQ